MLTVNKILCNFPNSDDSKHSRINKIRELGKKTASRRKEEVSGMVGILRDLKNSEINRTKVILEEHSKIFFENNEPEIAQVEPEIVNDDSYFQ